MDQLTCPICKGVSYPYYKYTDFFDDAVELFKCINCGHGSHNRKYTKQQFSEIYRSEYASDYLVKENNLYQLRQDQYKLDVKLLLDCRKFNSVRVLDYGCSSGGYLDAMPSEWQKSGYEVNPHHIEYVRKNKPHITLYDEVALIDNQFDLITLRGVIEHIPDHGELMEFIKIHLSPNGVVFITATPDISSVCSTLYKSRWNQVVCPEHIHQFSSTSLSILLARAGLALYSLNHPYLGTPYAKWMTDKVHFNENYLKLQISADAEIMTMHAFPGNMISAIYEKL